MDDNKPKRKRRREIGFHTLTVHSAAPKK